jgi:hypothetical protein
VGRNLIAIVGESGQSGRSSIATWVDATNVKNLINQSENKLSCSCVFALTETLAALRNDSLHGMPSGNDFVEEARLPDMEEEAPSNSVVMQPGCAEHLQSLS